MLIFGSACGSDVALWRNNPVPCLVSNPWHRTLLTRLWIRAVYTYIPLFLSPVLAYLGPEIVLLVNTLVWSSEQLTWSKLRLELVEKLVSTYSQAWRKRSLLAQCELSFVTASTSCIV